VEVEEHIVHLELEMLLDCLVVLVVVLEEVKIRQQMVVQEILVQQVRLLDLMEHHMILVSQNLLLVDGHQVEVVEQAVLHRYLHRKEVLLVE
tara:strand:+ start:481 stop:756 length:276 start_codon:yes stop_codon:yes gene_type:complete